MSSDQPLETSVKIMLGFLSTGTRHFPNDTVMSEALQTKYQTQGSLPKITAAKDEGL